MSHKICSPHCTEKIKYHISFHEKAATEIMYRSVCVQRMGEFFLNWNDFSDVEYRVSMNSRRKSTSVEN